MPRQGSKSASPPSVMRLPGLLTCKARRCRTPGWRVRREWPHGWFLLCGPLSTASENGGTGTASGCGLGRRMRTDGLCRRVGTEVACASPSPTVPPQGVETSGGDAGRSAGPAVFSRTACSRTATRTLCAAVGQLPVGSFAMNGPGRAEDSRLAQEQHGLPRWNSAVSSAVTNQAEHPSDAPDPLVMARTVGCGKHCRIVPPAPHGARGRPSRGCSGCGRTAAASRR